MIVYEITTKVDVHLIEEYEKFMKKTHIPDLLETGHFVSAEFAKISEGYYRVRYLAENKQELETYLDNNAEHLREDFIKKFPVGVKVSRKILKVLKTW